MSQEYFAPDKIEERSFEIITQELKTQIDETVAPIVKRVIHTTADFDYAENLFFSPDAVDCAIQLLKNGTQIFCDTNMVKSGINKVQLAKLGSETHCFIADDDVAQEAKKRGVTRAIVSVEKAAALKRPMIFAIGNAPTSLIRLHELWKEGLIAPELVIAAPVGFVNVIESKELFIDCGLPVIIARGRKGGSNVAAAICNALLYLAAPR